MFSSYRGRFAVAIRLIRATKWEGCFRCIDAGVLKCLGVCGREVLRFLQQSGREGGGEKARASLAPTFKDCCISAGEDGFPWPGGDGNWDNCDSWDRRFCAPLVLGFLDLWFVFLTHGFTHFCDGSRYGRKWSVDTLHGGFSFREQSERRNERLFLLEDRYKGVG